MKPLDFARFAALVKGRKVHLFLDFDGTLSPHRPDGRNSKLLPAARLALAELSRLPDARVCVVSGRPIADLRRRVGLRGISYAGNHGLAIEGLDGTFEHPRSDAARRAIAAAADLLREGMRRYRGVQINRNGLTLSLNVGLVDAAGRRAAAALVKASTPELARLRLGWQEGYLGWDLVPQVGWDKGHAVGRLLKGKTDVLAIAIGDGLSDEPMFKRVGKDGLSIRVGHSDSSAAHWWVRGAQEVASLLQRIVELRLTA